MSKRLKRIVELQDSILKYHGNPRSGITFSELDRIYRESGGLCAICGTKPPRKNLALDHSHDTGKIRGLLCVSCNVGLDMFKDDVGILYNAIKYLKRSVI